MATQPPRAPRYLLITDDPGIVDTGVVVALRHGFTVDAAPRDPESIAAAIGKCPDLVLLDLGGRSADAGLLFEAVRAACPRVPIALIAASGAPASILEDPAPVAKVHTPCSPDEILALIEGSFRAYGRRP
jgi:DNA-binding response OmpR family regulator